MNLATSTGNTDILDGTSTRVAPARAAAYRSKVDRSKWSGAWLDTTSSATTAYSSAAQSTNPRQARWLSITPFGVPVDPDV